MIDMKLSEKEIKDKSQPTSILDSQAYPYGLKITLDSESYDKIGFKKLPQVGEKMMMLCEVEVCSVYAEKYQGEKKGYSLGLQITQMEIKDKKSEAATEAVLYDKE